MDSPETYVLPYAYSLTEPYLDNMAKYNTLIIGLQIVGEYMEAYGASKLIINHVIKGNMKSKKKA